jgi:hypothetical protein
MRGVTVTRRTSSGSGPMPGPRVPTCCADRGSLQSPTCQPLVRGEVGRPLASVQKGPVCYRRQRSRRRIVLPPRRHFASAGTRLSGPGALTCFGNFGGPHYAEGKSYRRHRPIEKRGPLGGSLALPRRHDQAAPRRRHLPHRGERACLGSYAGAVPASAAGGAGERDDGLLDRRPSDSPAQPGRGRFLGLRQLDEAHGGTEGRTGPGAWAMLHWATKNPNAFFQQMLPKAMAAASKEVDRSGPDADGASDAAFEEIMRMMRKPQRDGQD